MKPVKGILCVLALIAGLNTQASHLSPTEPEAREARIESLVKASAWQAILDEFKAEYNTGQAPSWADAHYGRALFELGRLDEGAHYIDRAILALERSSQSRSPRTRRLRKKLDKADALSSRRSLFTQKTRRYFAECSSRLEADGHINQAVDLLERIEWMLTPDRDAELLATLERLRKANEEVDLDSVAGQSEAGETLTITSKHYILESDLEREVTEAVGQTMDDIYESYVQIYFGGKRSAAKIPKARIRIHSSWDEMIVGYPGNPEGVGGWWSPKDLTVTCYDTRNRNGDLTEMLSTLFHEASHQFMTVLSTDGGGSSPAWLNEGTASFFEGARALNDHRVLWPDVADDRLQNVCYMLAHNAGPGFDRVVSFSRPGSYPGEYYAYGWALAYYFQEYEDPKDLSYAWRPYYLEYLTTITSGRHNPRELFDRIFLAPGNPGGFTTFEEFSMGITKWILEEVQPLNHPAHGPNLRIKRAKRYMDAARDRDPAEQQDLWERSLRDLESIRTWKNIPTQALGDVLLGQIEVLNLLDRSGAEAWAIQGALDLADFKEWDGINDAAYEHLTARLTEISKSYVSLNLLRNRLRSLRRDASKILTSYEAKDNQQLRSFTFAQRYATVLKDPAMARRASKLRLAALKQGVLPNTTKKLDGENWITIFSGEIADFSHSPGAITLENRSSPVGLITEGLDLAGEYELRGTLGRSPKLKRGTLNGVVVSGTRTGPWTIVAFDRSGRLLVTSYTPEHSGGTARSPIELDEELSQPLKPGHNPSLVIHVFPDGRLEITVDDQPTVHAKLPYPLPELGHPGIFSKFGPTQLTNFLVESFS